MAFQQPDRENTFSELIATVSDLDLGAALIGIGSVLLLVAWDRSKRLKTSPVPAPLVVVLLGLGLNFLFRELGGVWTIGPGHLVQVPVPDGPAGFVASSRSWVGEKSCMQQEEPRFLRPSRQSPPAGCRYDNP